MPPVPDLTEQIAAEAAEPIASSGDGESATGRTLPELIEAHKFFKGQESVAGMNENGGPRSGWGGLRTARAVPPGAV